jgi:carboxymethylenebutenolidase
LSIVRFRTHTAAGGVGVLGFCGGGWNALLFGAQSTDVGAVVAYYAPVGSSDIQHRAPLDLASYIAVPVHYHGVRDDPDAPAADVDRLQAIITARGTPFERYTYDAKHGFFAFDRDGIFDSAAAKISWERTVTFLHKFLGRPAPVHRLAPAPSIIENGPRKSSGDHLIFHSH